MWHLISRILRQSNKRYIQLTCITHPIFSITTTPRPSNLSFAYCRCRCCTFEQFVPILFANQTAAEHVVSVTRHQGVQTFTAHEAFEMEDVWRRCGLLRRIGTAATRSASPATAHDKLAGGDRLAARRASSRVAEQPAGPLRWGQSLNLYHHIKGMKMDVYITITK